MPMVDSLIVHTAIRMIAIRFSGVLMALMLTAGGSIGVAGPLDTEPPNESIARSAQGTLQYRKMSTGVITGSEQWSMVTRPDGSRTLNTTNRINAAGLHRNVVFSVDRDFRPESLFASFWLAGGWVGTAMYTVDGDQLNIVAATPDGTFTQQRRVPERFGFIPHPPTSNAWQVGTYDREQGGVQMIPLYDLQTRFPGPGNMFGAMRPMALEFIEATQIDTPAGTFDVDHFRAGDDVDIFVHGPDAIIVRFVWWSFDEEYVLTSLTLGY